MPAGVKSLRAGKAQLVDSYVLLLKDGEAWLMGAHITPLTSASTHHRRPDPDPQAAAEQARAGQAVRRRAAEGLCLRSAVAVLEEAHDQGRIALAKGKKEFDKRHTEKERDSDQEIQRAMRTKGRTTDQPGRALPPRPPTPQHPSPRLCDAPTLSCRRCARASRWASCWPSASTSCT